MSTTIQQPSYVSNERLLKWVASMQTLCTPDFVY